MEIIELNTKEFNNIFSTTYYAFGKTDFNLMNKEKVDELLCLGFKDNKYRLGIIIGIKDGVLKSPFSAPFGSFIFLKDNIRINSISDSIKALEVFARQRGVVEINITLPPPIYNETFVSKQINSFFRENYKIVKVDLNYHFNLDKFLFNYMDNIWYNSKKNLKIALKENLKFHQCELVDERKLAYEIIRLNREIKGYPLRMSWEQITGTIEIINCDFFTVTKEEEPIAAALIFLVAPEIYQVIYWGDNPVYSKLKPMNYLSYKVFEHYKNKGAKIVDIGPSTENSIPNLGLAEFKESIGCDVSNKFSFSKIIQNETRFK